jgi:hypothetical protein
MIKPPSCPAPNRRASRNGARRSRPERDDLTNDVAGGDSARFAFPASIEGRLENRGSDTVTRQVTPS